MTTPATAPLKVDRKIGPDHREMYTNFVEFACTRMDFLWKFSLQRDVGPKHVQVTSVTDVTMSPQQAKSAYRALGVMLAAYEKEYGGPIPEEGTPAGTALQ